jgi:hypothetical protein
VFDLPSTTDRGARSGARRQVPVETPQTSPVTLPSPAYASPGRFRDQARATTILPVSHRASRAPRKRGSISIVVKRAADIRDG